MSELVLTEKSGKILGVHFAYVKIQRPGLKYKSEEKEYSVDVVVDKATAKEIKKKFPKNGVKAVETDEFENTFKFAPPYPEQEEQYVLKFKTNFLTKDGTEKPYEWSSRPKVYEPVEKGIKDVTMQKRVANGSSGDIAFNISVTEFGTIHHLLGILVKDMIELTSSASNPFGEVVEEETAKHEEEDVDDVGF